MKYLFFMALSCSLLSTSFLVALERNENSDALSTLIEVQPETDETAIAIAQEPSTDSIKARIEEISDAKNLEDLENASSSNATKTSQTEPLSWSGWLISWIINPSK